MTRHWNRLALDVADREVRLGYHEYRRALAPEQYAPDDHARDVAAMVRALERLAAEALGRLAELSGSPDSQNGVAVVPQGVAGE